MRKTLLELWIFFQIDITDEKQIDKLYEYIMDKYTRLDVLINNAAIVPMGAIDTVSISEWDLSYAVNLRAPVLLTKKFISSMRDTGGIIVFVPSAAPTPYMSAYEIFKTARWSFVIPCVKKLTERALLHTQ